MTTAVSDLQERLDNLKEEYDKRREAIENDSALDTNSRLLKLEQWSRPCLSSLWRRGSYQM